MPHPKGKLKQSGDVHLPDVESDLDLVEEGEDDLAALGEERRQPRGAAARVRDAGVSAGEPQDAGVAARPARGQTGTRTTPRPSSGMPAHARGTADQKDPRGLAAAFRQPVAHAGDRMVATARSASPWAIWAVALVAAAAVIKALR